MGLGQDSTALEESPERTLALRFALIGAVYFEIRRPGFRPRYALVLPEISDLERYANARFCFLRYGIQQLYTAGIADAGLRVLTELRASGLLEDMSSAFCRVISFGMVPWSQQQKTRVQLFTVQASSEQTLRAFGLCRQCFRPRFVKPTSGDPFWDVPQIPDLVARNLIAGRPWWKEFADFIADKQIRQHVFNYENGGLAKMIQDKGALLEGPKHTFLLACQEALRRHMGRKFARPGGADWGTEFSKVRVSIARCKNLVSFRETITDFWARGGSLHQGEETLLTTGPSWWQDALSLLDEKNWREAKDLALLALASYPGGTEEHDQPSSPEA